MDVQFSYFTPREVENAREQILNVYREAFKPPPYQKDESEVVTFKAALIRHKARKGFRFLAARETGSGSLLGFCYGYSSEPGQWWREKVAAELGPQLAARWLADCFEFVELAVLPDVQGRGIGGQLHDGCLANLPHQTAVLSTITVETTALKLYNRRGWVTLKERMHFPGYVRVYRIMGLDLARFGKEIHRGS